MAKYRPSKFKRCVYAYIIANGKRAPFRKTLTRALTYCKARKRRKK